jgi:hypothetical protein
MDKQNNKNLTKRKVVVDAHKLIGLFSIFNCHVLSHLYYGKKPTETIHTKVTH